jgi:hypothetical protein
MRDTDDSYEHAGEWNCSHCGETRDIEEKLDVLVFALGHSCDSKSKSE